MYMTSQVTGEAVATASCTATVQSATLMTPDNKTQATVLGQAIRKEAEVAWKGIFSS